MVSKSASEDHPTSDMSILDDLNKINALTPEIICRQATINIGTIGHVAHGKSTCVHALTGIKTVRFKDELERNITIKLGYANAKIFECSSSLEKCPRPARFQSMPSSTSERPPCKVCGSPLELKRHVSFVDCPGHDILMATMLNGAAVMDAAVLLIAGNESCPQPQTSEHLAALEVMRLNSLIVLQNKIDLTSRASAARQYEEIRRFTKGTVAASAPVLPVSAQLGYNMDLVCEYLCSHVPIPKRNLTKPPRLTIVRSFDVNKPGTRPEDLKGGVAGGTLLCGILRVGDEVEIRPGYITKDSAGRDRCTPIVSRIVSLHAEQNDLSFAMPGGLIGVGTLVDPTVARSDRLVGNVLGLRGKLPDIFTSLVVDFELFSRLLGVKKDRGQRKQVSVRSLSEEESLLLSIGSLSTGGRVKKIKENRAKIELNTPVCTEKSCGITLSRRIDKHWRLIGWGTIVGGKKINPTESSRD